MIGTGERLARAMADAAKSFERSAAAMADAAKRIEQSTAGLAALLDAARMSVADDDVPIDPNAPPVTGWRDWKGGFCPVPEGNEVWVMHRSGFAQKGIARVFKWRHYKGDPPGRGNDIVKWQPT